jgi:anti-sigma-K factor RskA
MKTHVMMHPRAEELLVERALRPLSEAEHAELASLGVDVADDSFDLTAAAISLAALPVEAMPADVFERLAEHTTVLGPRPEEFANVPSESEPAMHSAMAPMAPHVRTEDPRAVIPIDRARRRGVSVAWVAVAAAAGFVLALGIGLYTRRPDAPVALAPGQARTSLLHDGAQALAWTATTDTAAKGASGDVVWSAAQQRGYMRFVGLAVNDPKQWQYQLWIFDGTRDQAYPIDGGVFDVSSTGEVIVPISAKLHVDNATLFAVTVERPGGVVVSKRERIVVTAKPG